MQLHGLQFSNMASAESQKRKKIQQQRFRDQIFFASHHATRFSPPRYLCRAGKVYSTDQEHQGFRLSLRPKARQAAPHRTVRSELYAYRVDEPFVEDFA